MGAETDKNVTTTNAPATTATYITTEVTPRTSTTSDFLTTTKKPIKTSVKPKAVNGSSIQQISARNNNDTSVNGIPEYIRNTLLETTTERVDLEFKPFYSVPARTYGDPTSYEASIFYEPPDENENGEIYEFDSPQQSSRK